MLIPLQMTSDARVVRRVLCGRRDEFSVLVDRYYRPVLSVVKARLESPADAEDVAQETFVSAYQKLDTLHAPERFGPWLMAIARNAAYSWTRRRKIEVLVPDAADIAGHGTPPRVEQNELREIVRGKLAELEPEQREILMLFYFGGKSLGEVASLLDISRSAAEKRLQRARAAFSAEFLKAVGEVEKPEDLKKARKNVMAAVAAAPVAWKVEAAAAGWASLVVVKVLVVLLTIAAVGTGAAHVYRHSKNGKLPSVAESATAVNPVVQTAAAPAEVASAAAAPELAQKTEDEPLPAGPGKIFSQLVTDDTHEPVADAEVVAEWITWGPREMPPARTFKWTTRSGKDGKFLLEDLPVGFYCILAKAPGLFGIDSESAESKELDLSTPTWALSMRPSISISGRLVGPDGAPIPGTVLYPVQHVMMPEEEFDHTTVASARAETGADGTFTFPAILPGKFKFFILVPNRPSLITEYTAMEGELLFKLENPGVVTGRVTDTTDNVPKSGIKVRVCQGQLVDVTSPSDKPRGYKPDHRVVFETESDSDGSFRVASLWPGKYVIETDDATFLNASPDQEFEVKPGADTFAEVRIAKGATIRGRVYNKDNGQGIAGISVNDWATGATAVTDGNGQYVLGGLRPGNHEISLPVQSSVALPNPNLNRIVAAGYGEEVGDINFVLPAPSAVKGHVVDRNGAPVPLANIRVTSTSFSFGGITDAEGAFSFNNVTSVDFVIEAKKDGWESEPAEPGLNKEILLRLIVPAGGAIHGKLLSAEGKPLTFREVYLHAQENGKLLHHIPPIETGSDGQFKFENLRAGTYNLEANPPDAALSVPLAEGVVTLAQNQIVRDLVLQAHAQGSLSLTGRVTTFDGKPIKSGTVFVYVGNMPKTQIQSATIGADGDFSIKGLAETQCRVVATAAGYSPAILDDVTTGAKSLDIQLGPLGSMSGTVTDASTGKPVDAYKLSCQIVGYVNEGSSASLVKTIRNETGEFSIEQFAALPTELKVFAPGYAAYMEQVAVAANQANRLSIQLQPEAVIAGVVVDSDGNPISGASAGLSEGAPVEFSEGPRTTAEDGTFKINQLPEGQTVKIAIGCHGYAPQVFEVTAQRAPQDNIVFTLKRAGAVEVHALLDGEAVSEFRVTCGDSFLPMREGNVVSLVPEGDVELTVALTREDEVVSQQTVKTTVVAGQTTPVEVRFESGGEEAP